MRKSKNTYSLTQARQRGRLWALQNSPQEPVFQSFDTGLPTLFTSFKQATLWQQRINMECEAHVQVVEVELREVRHD